jgi:nucleoside-diphosphate-sugar epimerase
MDIIGDGFLARNLRPLAGSHPGVVVLARGVSTTRELPASEYGREAAMVHDMVERCRRQCRLLVFLSTASAALYGTPGCSGREDAELAPSSRYGRHKLALERVVRDSGIRHLILRLTHVVGPYAPPHQMLPSVARAVLSGKVTVERGIRRDLIGSSDVRTIIDALLTDGVAEQTVNVASGELIAIERVVDHVELRLGLTARRHLVCQPPSHAGSLRRAVSLEKLRRLVPAVAGLGFGPGYYRSAIDQYLAARQGSA